MRPFHTLIGVGLVASVLCQNEEMSEAEGVAYQIGKLLAGGKALQTIQDLVPLFTGRELQSNGLSGLSQALPKQTLFNLPKQGEGGGEGAMDAVAPLSDGRSIARDESEPEQIYGQYKQPIQQGLSMFGGPSEWMSMAGSLLEQTTPAPAPLEDRLFPDSWARLARNMISTVDPKKEIRRSAADYIPVPEIQRGLRGDSQHSYESEPVNAGLLNGLTRQMAMFGSQNDAGRNNAVQEQPAYQNPIEQLTSPLAQLLTPQQQATQLETGGVDFDRFIVKEKDEEGAGGLLGGLSQGWKKQGVQWKDGNIRLVDMRGRDVLGTQLAVHDKSVDIPVQMWLDAAGAIFESVQKRQQ